jgi:hypothetical protein
MSASAIRSGTTSASCSSKSHRKWTRRRLEIRYREATPPSAPDSFAQP